MEGWCGRGVETHVFSVELNSFVEVVGGGEGGDEKVRVYQDDDEGALSEAVRKGLDDYFSRVKREALGL